MASFWRKGSPGRPWARERCCGRVDIVVRLPAREMRAEHEVYAVLFKESGGLIFFGPHIHLLLDLQVVRCEFVDVEAVWSLSSLVP